MSDLTFYIVQPCQGNIFFNKIHCLVYGKLLKQLLKDGVIAKILYYKQPSFKHKVYYQKYVDELFDEHISDNKFEDEKIKKNIANINIGLLEKGSNKASRNKMFDNLKEAMAFQKNWGGKLYVIDDDGQEYKYVTPSSHVHRRKHAHHPFCIVPNKSCRVSRHRKLHQEP